MNLVLLLDTSTQGVSLGFIDLDSEKPGLLWKASFLERNGSAQRLSVLFDQGLNSLERSSGDISAVVVSTGPGSFTGIKVGMAWIQGLSKGLRKDLKYLSVSSIEAAAEQLHRTMGSKNIEFAMGSTRTHGFRTTVISGKCQTELIDITSDKFIEEMKARGGSAELILGNVWPGMTELADNLERSYRGLSDSVTADLVMRGMAGQVHKIGLDHMKTRLDEPNFMRKSTAEERLEIKKGN